MSLNERIFKIRTGLRMSQAEFAEQFGVSQQTVQKWESGDSHPELSKLIEISRRYDISLDTLVLDRDMRMLEEIHSKSMINPSYVTMNHYDLYASALLEEYQQCIDEGLDIESYHDIFLAISKLPSGEIKKKFGDTIFDIVISAKTRENYPYIEPSELEGIKKLRVPYPVSANLDKKSLEDKIHGAWLGRICGCMLGKTVEGIRSNELVPLLRETGNYPMHRYILKSDIDRIDTSKFKFDLSCRPYADEIDGMPSDDDTNYMVMAQNMVNEYGRDFAPVSVSQTWIKSQPRDAYCTAERVAFKNFINGYEPPFSAIYKNAYREWIGAQIRIDYFGYINPGDPELAAEMAWRDASISHVKNGIYGAMFVAAMIASAAVTDNIEDIIHSGLAQIPHTSRLYEDITSVLESYKRGVSQKDCFRKIHEKYDEYSTYGWCHTNPNAMIVVASLLYGESDYARSICMAVETAFDTDCNGATVGSILGMANGTRAIPECWSAPINDTLYTTIFGAEKVKISEMAKNTMNHLK